MQRARPRILPALRVSLFAFVLFAYFMPRWADWNIDSRLDLVHAIVDRHTLRIDAFHWNTWDKAVYKGHYFSDKAPGTAMLGVPVYAVFVALHSLPVSGAVMRAIERSSAWDPALALGVLPRHAAPAPEGATPGGCKRAGVTGNVQTAPWGNRLVPPMREWAFSKYVITVGVVGTISALFAGFLFWFLGYFFASLWLRWLVVGFFAFATDAFPYSTNFYSHEIAAACLFTAFALLFLYSRRLTGVWVAPAAGFLLGFAVFAEYTVVPVAALIGLYGLWTLRLKWGSALALVGSGLLPVLGVLAYNAAAFSGPLDTGYSHDFCWSAAQAAGFAGFTYPHLGALFDLTFGSFRGLVYMSPFLLFALPGALIMVRRGLRREAILSLGAAIGFIVLLSAYWGWNGGKVEGPRYLVPIIPLLAFPVAFFLDQFRANKAAMAIFGLAGIVSLFVVWAEFLGSALFPISWLRDPLVQYSLPALRRDDIAPNLGLFFGLSGWHSLVPLVLLLACIFPWPALFSHRHSARTGQIAPVPRDA
jgi:hypothetical protein